MKKKIRITLAALFMTGLISGACGPKGQKNDQTAPPVQRPSAAEEHEAAAPVFADAQLARAYEQYILLKNALIASDADQAAVAAAGLQTALEETEGAEKAVQLASGIKESAGLEEQRKAFSGLSNAMTDLVKSAGMASGEVYLAYCPMADNDAGAFWLSSEQEIRNPYFGDKMMKCGSVKEIIR